MAEARGKTGCGATFPVRRLSALGPDTCDVSFTPRLVGLTEAGQRSPWGTSHLVGFWPLRVGLQAGGPYGPPLAAVAVDSVAWPPGRAKDRLNRATGGVPPPQKKKVGR